MRGPGSIAPRGRRPWAELSRVEHVELYTQLSLLLGVGLANALALIATATQLDDVGPAAVLLLGGTAVTVLGVWILSSLLERREPGAPLPWRRAVALVVVGTAYLGTVAEIGTADARGAAALAVVITVSLAFGVLPDNRIGVLLIVGGALVPVLAGDRDGDGGPAAAAFAGAFVAAVLVITGRLSVWLLVVVRELDDARQVQGALAVAEERLRFSRDVHDVLGRRLSTIAVQAELAATLAKRGDDRAPAQMLEVREVAHQALREARELARGYRATHFGQELEGARSLLRSAGIDVELAVDDMPHGWHEAAGWVVRESVTNVLRHSTATRVQITYEGSALRVRNDGVRAGELGEGAGLQGLRERLAPLGASLTAERDDDGWSVVATLPGTGPLSAVTAGGRPS